MDTSTSGTTYWDMTGKSCWPVPVNANAVEIMFYGEADDSDSAGCRIFGKSSNGPAEKIAEVSIRAGQAICPSRGSTILTTCNTAWRMADSIILDGSNNTHIRDVTVADPSANRVSKIHFDVAGYSYLYCEFYNVGDDTEYTTITPYGRYF